MKDNDQNNPTAREPTQDQWLEMHSAPIRVPPNGIYDNKRMMRREHWRDGELTEWCWASRLRCEATVNCVFADPDAWRRPWGKYPDAPNPKLTGLSGEPNC